MTQYAQENDLLVSRARDFAEFQHDKYGQLRLYTGEPYIVHPAEVVSILSSAPHTPEMLAAGWLHDVVEDTPVTYDEIATLFGQRVSDLVRMVTDISLPSDGNRAARKEIDRLHLAEADAEGQTIKLADLISNVSSIVQHDTKFAAVYLPEKRALLDVLVKGDALLYEKARDSLIVAESAISAKQRS